MSDALGVGVVGCGSISAVYLRNLGMLPGVRLVACADVVRERAARAAEAHAVPRVLETDALLDDPEVDLVLNLTRPAEHVAVSEAALRAGKHVYSEKPLAVELDEADRLLEDARTRGVRIGCAPDTFLGAGLGTCRRLIDQGEIGSIVGGAAFFACPGHESWHPDPAFYYGRGGGPLLDMGPYYVTALVALLGPVRRVCGCVRTTHEHRTIASEPRRGERIAVEMPTHCAGVLELVSGAIVSIMMSFDVHAACLPHIEIYGDDGTLDVPDPNMFDGPVEVYQPRVRGWRERDLVSDRTANLRGLGVSDMAEAIAAGRAHRASGELARHVLEILLAVEDSSRTGRRVELATSCERPEAI